MLTPREELITIYQHILYIADETYNRLLLCELPPQQAFDYAVCCAGELQVALNMRGFVAREACILVNKWKRDGIGVWRMNVGKKPHDYYPLAIFRLAHGALEGD